jgi:hypothetical protein
MRSIHGLVLLFAGLAVVSGALAACGDDTTPTSTDDSTGTTDDGDSADGDSADDGAADDGDTGDGSADEPMGGPYPVADLNIDYSHDDGTAFSYRIVCLGDTATLSGDHKGITDSGACLALADPDVQQRLVEGPPSDRMCTEQYGGSDVAVITGLIDDQPVDTRADRTDGCGISEWEDLLAAILPPAIGVQPDS